jgi:hypothetical protein
MGPEDRGRSPHRLSKPPKGVSPRGKLSSPLARVAEENPAPIRVHTNLDAKAATPSENLISMDTPRPSDELPTARLPTPRDSLSSDKENNKENQDTKPEAPSSLKSPKSVKSPIAATAETEDLKTVEI